MSISLSESIRLSGFLCLLVFAAVNAYRSRHNAAVERVPIPKNNWGLGRGRQLMIWLVASFDMEMLNRLHDMLSTNP